MQSVNTISHSFVNKLNWELNKALLYYNMLGIFSVTMLTED